MKEKSCRSLCRTWLGLAVALWAMPLPGQAQSLTQNFVLKPGWNSIYLEVTPLDQAVGHVFADPAIDSVWEPRVRGSTVAFIQNQNEAPFNRAGWTVYVPTNRVDSINNDLFSVRANRAYLVRVAGNNPVSITVAGRPSVRQLAFQPDSFTLRGFAIDPAAPPTFRSFFAASPAHSSALGGGLQRIYRLNNGTSQWELVGSLDPIERGVAYWVYTAGSSSYTGPLMVTLSQGDGLSFGLTAAEQDLTLKNQGQTPLTITIRDTAVGNRPLVYDRTDATNLVLAWVPLPQTYVKTIAPGASQRLRIGIQRSQMTTDSYDTVLFVSDGAGGQVWVPVNAQRRYSNLGTQTKPRFASVQDSGSAELAALNLPAPVPVGLWVGDITVNRIAETYNNLTNTTPTQGGFDLRLILHVTTNGVTRLLREVIEMYQNGTYATNSLAQRVLVQQGTTVLVTDDALLSRFTGVALRDRTPVGRRISSAGFDFDAPGGTNFITMSGSFGIGNTVSCTLNLTPASPTNPFLHRFHPDHDNLDTFFTPIAATNRVQEVYTISRQIELAFTPADPAGLTAIDYGYDEIGGIYSETITGLHRNPLATNGTFHLRRVTDTPSLNQNQ